MNIITANLTIKAKGKKDKTFKTITVNDFLMAEEPNDYKYSRLKKILNADELTIENIQPIKIIGTKFSV